MIILRAVTTSVIWSGLGASAWACPVCFRMDDGPVSDGVRAAILVLMGVTTTVLAGFAVFIRGFMQRERTPEPRNATPEPRNATPEPRNPTPEPRNPTPEPRNLGTQPRNPGTPEPRH